MTIIVSVKINDGIVMASDSAGSMGSGQVYTNANKIAKLCRGLPVGAMSTGSGGIGNESVETLFKVKVKSVNIMRMPGKERVIRRKGAAPRPMGAREWKKAIVTLTEGQSIDALKA